MQLLIILLTLSIASTELGTAPEPPRLREDGAELSPAQTLDDGSTLIPPDRSAALNLYLHRWQQYPARCQTAIDVWGARKQAEGLAALESCRADCLAASVSQQRDAGHRYRWWEVALIVGGTAIGVGSAAFVAGAVWGVK